MKKRKLMLVFGILVLLIVIVAMLYRESKIAVLCYHNIGTKQEKENFPEEKQWTIDVENFEEQLQYLQKHHYKTLTLDEFYQWKKRKLQLPFKSVLITFDDGFLSNYQYAFPLLKKYDMNAVVFVIGDYVHGKTETWNGNLKTYFSKEILNKCKQEYPNIEICSHSYGLHEHGRLKEKDNKQIEEDIKRFRNTIVDTQYYCYPFGAYDDRMIKVLKKNDYKLAFLFGPTRREYRKASRRDDDYRVPRLDISHGMNITKFALRLLLPY